jgi:branched-chain amino acid transport system substrate-binding protein
MRRTRRTRERAPLVLSGAALLVFLCTLLVSCSRSAAPLVIGGAGPWKEGYGAMNKLGIELAIAEINSRGGIKGRQLHVVLQDDEGKGERAAEIAAEFVNTPELMAVVGHVNSGAMVAASHVYDGALAAVATTATSPELTGISPWVFRVISSDSANGIALAKFASQLGHRRAAILYENNSYGRGLAGSFQRNFAGEVVTIDPIPDGASDLEPFVSYYVRKNVDIVFSAGTDGSGVALLREARRQNYHAAFLGGDGWTGITNDTSAAEGVYVGAPFTAEDQRPEAQRFVRTFRQKYGQVPDGNAALAYDATMLVAEAIRTVGPDRHAIRDYLADLNERTAFHGVTGTIRFQPDGDPVGKSFVMTRVVQGSLVVADVQ